MVSDTIQKTIKEIFPNVEIFSYAAHESYITIPELHPVKLQELIDKTARWSGCVWFIKGDTHYGHVEIHFKHTSFSTN